VTPEQVDRFRADFDRALGSVLQGPIALAVSGGPDSMAMLALAAAAFPGRAIAATVDHGLRPESADEAAMVASACAGLNMRHEILRITVPLQGNLHAWARRERYDLLGRWAKAAGAGALCTAHHADDQAETFLMRAARASGLAGLAGVRTRSDGVVPVVRPLLGWRRAELRSLVEGAGLPFVDDPSNDDPRFDRARFRQWIGQAPWIDPLLIARSAEYLAGAEADLRAVSDWLWEVRAAPMQENGVSENGIKIDVAGLPRAIRRSLARRAIEAIAGVAVQDSIENLLDALEAGNAATRSDVHALVKGDVWHFRKAPPRRTF